MIRRLAALFARPSSASDSARTLGALGGKARADKLRQPIRAKAQKIRRELGLADDPRLA